MDSLQEISNDDRLIFKVQTKSNIFPKFKKKIRKVKQALIVYQNASNTSSFGNTSNSLIFQYALIELNETMKFISEYEDLLPVVSTPKLEIYIKELLKLKINIQRAITLAQNRDWRIISELP